MFSTNILPDGPIIAVNCDPGNCPFTRWRISFFPKKKKKKKKTLLDYST